MPGRTTSSETRFPARFPGDPDLPGVGRGFRIADLTISIAVEKKLPLSFRLSTSYLVKFQIGSAS
jgi:hypothetical protein